MLLSSSEWITLFGGTGVVQGIFLSLYLLNPRLSKKKDNRILAALLFCLSGFILLIIYNFFTDNWNHYPVWSLLGISAIGPLSFFYVARLLGKKTGNTWLHAIFPLMLLLEFVIYLLPFDLQSWRILIGTIVVQLAIYIGYNLYSIFSIMAKEKAVTHLWLLAMQLGMLLIWGALFGYMCQGICIINVSFVFTLVVYGLGFLGMWHHRIFLSKYNNSNFSPQFVRNCFCQIKQYLEATKAYKEPHLNLPNLALALQLSVPIISRAINETTGMNFKEFIKQYRIKEAQKMLQNRDFAYRNISSIAYESGFKSLSVFNTAFKKKNNCTPSEFRNRYL